MVRQARWDNRVGALASSSIGHEATPTISSEIRSRCVSVSGDEFCSPGMRGPQSPQWQSPSGGAQQGDSVLAPPSAQCGQELKAALLFGTILFGTLRQQHTGTVEEARDSDCRQQQVEIDPGHADCNSRLTAVIQTIMNCGIGGTLKPTLIETT